MFSRTSKQAETQGKTYATSVKGIKLDYSGGDPKPKIAKFTFIFGLLHDIYPRVMFYYSPLASLMSIAVAYKVVALTTPALSWLTFPLFLALIAGGAIIVGLFVWFFTIPQTFYYGNWLALRNGSIGTKLALDRFDRVDKELKEIKEALERSNDNLVNQNTI